jgi:LysM repeat protein
MGRQHGSPPLFLSMVALAVIVVALLVYPILTNQKNSGGTGSRTPNPSQALDSGSAEPTDTPGASPTYRTHVVQKNEFLQSIATRYGVTWQAIAALNNITDPSKIYPNEVLLIPWPSSATATPSVTPIPSPTVQPTPP